MHTTKCEKCGKEFSHPTQASADHALRMHIGRAHGKLGPGHGDLKADEPGARAFGKKHPDTYAQGRPLPEGVSRAPDGRYTWTCPHCGHAYARKRVDLLYTSIRPHMAKHHPGQPVPVLRTTSPPVAGWAPATPTPDGRWQVRCPRCENSYVRGTKSEAESWLRRHLRQDHQMEVPRATWGSSKAEAPTPKVRIEALNPQPLAPATPALSVAPAPLGNGKFALDCPECQQHFESNNDWQLRNRLRYHLINIHQVDMVEASHKLGLRPRLERPEAPQARGTTAVPLMLKACPMCKCDIEGLNTFLYMQALQQTQTH